MRAASPALVALLNQLRADPDAQILCADCYTLILRNGTALAYTNVDVPIALNGYVYLANSVLIDGLKFKCSVGLAVDQQQITISARSTDLLAGVPLLAAVRNGALDGCEIQRERAFFASWGAPPVGSVVLFKGRVSTVDKVGRASAQITVASDLTLLDINMPRNLYSPSCVHVLFDTGCGLTRNSFAAAGTVGPGATNATIPWSGAAAAYEQGTILFTSGVNAGVSANIKSAGAGALTLNYPLLNAPASGDSFTAYQGCDHTQATCQSKFNNLANFRGFPYVPPPTYAMP
jgi:uncharacterized phage protein (TIGR02218 family)